MDTPAAECDAPPGEWQVCNRAVINPMFGLIRLECAHRSARPLDGAIVHVAFGGQSAAIPAGRLVAPSNRAGDLLRVHLVTHLVADGMQAFAARIVLPDGAVRVLAPAVFEVRNAGALAGIVRQDLLAAGTPAILEALVDSRMFPADGGLGRAWFDAGDDMPVPLSLEPAPSADAARAHLRRWGFAVLDHVIDAATVAQFRAEYEAAIDDGRLAYRRGSSDRVEQAHRLPGGRSIWLDETILAFLRDWFRDEPCACQTLLYLNGSEQGAHQDTIHLTPYPAGFMCGVWVALQDVAPDSGELFVMPGSHRLPRLTGHDLGLAKVTEDYSQFARFAERIDAMVGEGGYAPLTYRPRAGQVLVWHENLIHGGAPRRRPELSRHSVVSHYFARGSVAYYDARGEAAFLEAVE